MPLRTGVSYLPAVSRIDQRFSPKDGDVILLEELRAVVQPADEKSFNALLRYMMKVWRGRALRPSRRGAARGIGIAFLTPAQEGEECDHSTLLSGRRQKRLTARVLAIDDTHMSEQQRAQQSIRARVNLELQKQHNEANKQLRPPPAKSESDSNVRILKR